MAPTVMLAGVSTFVTLSLLGCQGLERTERRPPAAACGSSTTTYHTIGKPLWGDVDGDGRADRVTLRVDPKRPLRCRHLLVAETTAGATAAGPLKPLAWPGTDPRLLLLAHIDAHPGLEPVVALAPAAVYRPGAVFTMRGGRLVRMRRDVEANLPDDLFPFEDEFPAGVDCAGAAGAIVTTVGSLARGGRDDRSWDLRRSFYRSIGTRFELVREQRFRVPVGPGAEQRWRELRGDPFPSCPGRVD